MRTQLLRPIHASSSLLQLEIVSAANDDRYAIAPAQAAPATTTRSVNALIAAREDDYYLGGYAGI